MDCVDLLTEENMSVYVVDLDERFFGRVFGRCHWRFETVENGPRKVIFRCVAGREPKLGGCARSENPAASARKPVGSMHSLGGRKSAEFGGTAWEPWQVRHPTPFSHWAFPKVYLPGKERS